MKTPEEIQKVIDEAEGLRDEEPNLEEVEYIICIIDTLNWILSDTHQHPLENFKD